jgi:hypothetical protein
VKAYNAFQEIRSSTELNTEQNKQLEDNIRAAQGLRDSLRPPSAPNGTAYPVDALSKKCTLQANNLLKTLEYVRGSGEKIGPVRAIWRLARNRGRIEKLRSSLAENRIALDQMISQKLM